MHGLCETYSRSNVFAFKLHLLLQPLSAGRSQGLHFLAGANAQADTYPVSVKGFAKAAALLGC